MGEDSTNAAGSGGLESRAQNPGVEVIESSDIAHGGIDWSAISFEGLEVRCEEEVKAFADLTNKAEDLLAGKKTQRLLLLQSSQRYMDQHIKRFELAKAQCGKPAVQRAALEKARVEQAEEARRVHAEIKKIRTATHETQKKT